MSAFVSKYQINSICEAFLQLSNEGLPEDIICQAVAANDWFTPFYIQRAFERIKGWHTQAEIYSFLEEYPIFLHNHSPLTVGVIGAGNIPFVAWHDILMILLSGNKAKVKLSRQDNILIPFIISRCAKIFPEISTQIEFTNDLSNIDFLIATGSDNTARQLAYRFRDIPKIIRKHRFSVGIWGGEVEDLQGISEDVLLYNGLGCRNISVLFVPDIKDTQQIETVFSHYPQMLLSANYLQKLEYEKARLTMLNIPFIDAGSLLLLPKEIATPGEVGTLTLAQVERFPSFCKQYQTKIQCITGQNFPHGSTQFPKLGDFADDIDTFLALISLSNTLGLSNQPG